MLGVPLSSWKIEATDSDVAASVTLFSYEDLRQELQNIFCFSPHRLVMSLGQCEQSVEQRRDAARRLPQVLLDDELSCAVVFEDDYCPAEWDLMRLLGFYRVRLHSANDDERENVLESDVVLTTGSTEEFEQRILEVYYDRIVFAQDSANI